MTALFPLAWMAIAGFKGQTEVLRTPFQFFPDVWQLDNYRRSSRTRTFMRAMGITFVGAVIFTVAEPRGELAWRPTRSPGSSSAGKRLWWVFCITPMFIPAMAILLTSFVVVTQARHAQHAGGAHHPGRRVGAQMFFIRQFYLDIPVAVEEAALIDGASRWQIFLRIFLPQSPGLSSSWASPRSWPTGTPTSGRS